MVHEWLHNDNVGAAVVGSHITDVSTDSIRAYGPYWTRQLLRTNPGQCILNADNYVWLALEVFWTKLCLKNGRYKDPVGPAAVSCQYAADPSGAMGVCPLFQREGWCDCGSAGDFVAVSSGSNPCPYTTLPQGLAPVNLYENCGPKPPATASSPQCGPNDASVSAVQAINQQLDAWGDESLCCSDGSGGCANVAVSGNVAVDLCSTSKTPLCMGCARMANYLEGILNTCQKDGQVGGKQAIVEMPGLEMEI
ncbi:hypothetical protein VTN77DRAFT_6582 [Rasamsonia byssochlamydoides]|uniref:uncharacterized protein n=1 Tax=Rasamsonia byssochlamydoides TaxID=89139 RepID=UPI003742C1CB